MNKTLPTSGQIERELAQKIQKFYHQELEHLPSKVTCQLFGNQLAIIIEDAVTAVQKTLANVSDNGNTIKQLNRAINQTIKSKLKILIQEILEIKVKDILFDSTLKSNLTGAIVVLERIPEVCNPKSIPKNKPAK